MGQRLNTERIIEIVDNDKTLANSYYHWSAYTDSAVALVVCFLTPALNMQRRMNIWMNWKKSIRYILTG